MSQSYSPCLLSQPPRAKKQRITHVTAVFSDEWNWSFNPTNLRSRRQRFPNSGEAISGFTAIFCDDWKDDMDEEEDNDDYIWPPKREREEDMDFSVQHRDSSQSRYKRQRLESPVESLSFSADPPECQLSPSANSPPKSLSFTAISPESQLSLYTTSPEPQIDQCDEFESEKWPPTPGDLEYIFNSKWVDSDEEKLLTPGYILSEDLHRMVPTSVETLEHEIAAPDKVNRNLYLALPSKEAENSSSAVTNLYFKTKKPNGIFHLCEEASGEQRPQNDGCEAEAEGFEFWDDFMRCCMGVQGEHEVKECLRLDIPQERRFELFFEGVIDC